MPAINPDPFDISKEYRKLDFYTRALLFGQDCNHAFSIQRSAYEKMGIGICGWAIRPIEDFGGSILHNPCFVDLRTNDQLHFDEGGLGNGVYGFNLIDATHLQWRHNLGVWYDNGGPGYVVVNDGVTWNYDVGGSGFDLIVSSNPTLSDTNDYAVSKGIRLGGGEILSTGVANQIVVKAGHFIFQNRWVDVPVTFLNGLVDDDFIYYSITKSTVDYTGDTDLEHLLPDGRLHPIAPKAEKMVYTLSHAQEGAIPVDTATVKNVIVARVNVAGGGVVTVSQMWVTGIDLQSLYGEYHETLYSPDCLIAGADPGPTFTISNVDMFDGFELDITAVSTNTETVRIWMVDGAGPPATTDVNLYGEITCDSVRNILVPHYENGEVSVKLMGVDSNGNVQANSVTHNLDLGNQIAGADPGPTFTLAAVDSYEGFKINISAVAANTERVRVWIRDGAAPTLTEDYLYDDFKCDATGFGGSRDIYIPYYENGVGRVYVTLKSLDEHGIEQTLSSTQNLYIRRFTLGIYKVAKSGEDFTSITAALTQALTDFPIGIDNIEIHVYAGVYYEDITIPAGFLQGLTIRGFGNARIHGTLNLDNATFRGGDQFLIGNCPATASSHGGDQWLKFLDLTIYGRIVRNTHADEGTAGNWPVLFRNCQLEHNTSLSSPFIYIEQDDDSPSWNWFFMRFENCFITSRASTSQVIEITGAGAGGQAVGFHFTNCSIVGTNVDRIFYIVHGATIDPPQMVHACRLVAEKALAVIFKGGAGAPNHVYTANNFWFADGGYTDNIISHPLAAGTNPEEPSIAFLRRC